MACVTVRLSRCVLVKGFDFLTTEAPLDPYLNLNLPLLEPLPPNLCLHGVSKDAALCAVRSVVTVVT